MGYIIGGFGTLAVFGVIGAVLDVQLGVQGAPLYFGLGGLAGMVSTTLIAIGVTQ